jgi:hypothetical protein
MVRYFYALTPLVLVATIFLLALPWLGLIALMVVTLVAVPALALAILAVPYMLVHALARRVHPATPEPAAAASGETHSPLRTG